ncbi:NFATC2-interacting protein-like [Anneissia japonica]|uniref:NFATC2-interacting protein-like n=1 Tax=Anneissia japonica TaxID=1529436 RepID=UPI00142563EF|nr:NFATC2-interacting protein-like [Anneissia japonica]
MEKEVQNGKPKQKKRATRKREPISLATASVSDLYAVDNFDLNVQKLAEEAIELSENEDEIIEIIASSKKTNCEKPSTRQSETKPNDSIMIDSDEELNSSQQSRGSPSPPTPPPVLEIGHQRPSRKLAQVIQHAGQAVSNYRAKKSQEGQPVVLLDDDTPSPKKQRRAIVVKIRSKSGLHRTVLQMEENFETVFNELAAKEGVNLNQIMLSRGEQIIKISDTPACLKLQLAHILDCVIVDSLNNSSLIENLDEDATVRVKVQGTGKNLSTVISILKTSTFHTLRKKYSEFVGVSEAKIKFRFDGEPVNMNSKPADLEIEDDDIIDAIVT